VNWISLSIFVFKMESIRHRLSSPSFQEFIAKQKRTQLIKYVFISFLASYCVFASIVDGIDIYTLKDELSLYKISAVVVINDTFRGFKFLIDLCLYWIFTRCFLFFFKQKKEKTGEITRFNIFILCMTFTLMLITFAHSVIAFIMIFVDEDFRWIDRNLIPGKDFLISTAMVYLFYYQAQKAESMRRAKKAMKTINRDK
jgi:hypothetical protein